MRNLSIKGKIVVFKTLATSKLVYLALLTVIPNRITDKVAKILKTYGMIHFLKLNMKY